MYESRIESFLKRHGVSSDEFFSALFAAELAVAEHKSLATSLMLVQDFGAFFKLSQQRALEQAG